LHLERDWHRAETTIASMESAALETVSLRQQGAASKLNNLCLFFRVQSQPGP